MQYDVGKATITVTIFFAIYSAGKTCVYSFLTVYFRHLGISPFQSGVLRSIQSLIGGVAVPSVAYCSALCLRRRLTMIVCIFLTMASYLVLLVMSLPSYSCFVRIPSNCDSFTSIAIVATGNETPLTLRQETMGNETLIKPDTTDLINSSIESIYNRIWPQTNVTCFVMLAVILIVGEMVAAPVDNIASDTWFVYLDEIDYTESHRKHLSYIPITTALVISLIGFINLAICNRTGIGSTPYHINFYTFGLLLGIAILIVSIYPTPQRRNSITRCSGGTNKIWRYFCTNPASTLLVATVTISGILYATLHDYLLWYVEDLNGGQFSTGLTVAVAFLSDAIAKVILGRHDRLSTNGLIVLGITCYAVRFFIYTALSSIWGIIATQLLHGFCNVLFWKGIVVQVRKSYDSKAEQQILHVLHSLHYVLGYTIGTLMAGYLYNVYRPTVLFWVMGGIGLTWAAVLFLCFFAFNVRLVKPTDGLQLLDGEDVSLFSVNSDHEDDEQ